MIQKVEFYFGLSKIESKGTFLRTPVFDLMSFDLKILIFSQFQQFFTLFLLIFYFLHRYLKI